jgi:hypothetical protein
MDSSIVVNSGGTETFIAVSQLAFSLLVIPLIAVLRKYTQLFVVIDPTQFQGIIMVGLMWGLSAWMKPDMTAVEIIEKAFAVVGFTSVAYRTLVKKGGAAASLDGALNKFGRRTINQ